MAADVVRERSEQVLLGSAHQQTVEQAQTIDAEQVREDPADADPRRIEDLVDTVADPRSFACPCPVALMRSTSDSRKRTTSAAAPRESTCDPQVGRVSDGTCLWIDPAASTDGSGLEPCIS